MPKKTAGPSGTDKAENPLEDIASSQRSRSEEDLRGSPSSQEITELGVQAATALSDPLWKTGFDLTLQEIIASWLQSDVSETQLRESLWHRAQSLFSLEEILVTQVNAAKQVALTEEERAEQDLSRYEDEQGFGLEDLPGYGDDN